MVQYQLGDFMKDVICFLNTLKIKKTDTLIVGVSFGPDSMCLLHILKNKYKDNKIVCAHVHHNHRKESDEEALKLKEYCDKHNIIFEMMKIQEYKDNKFTEEEARNKRYSFFDELIKKYKSKYLFVAHHGDDLVETILMRIVRGSTLKGYAAMPLVSTRNKYNIVRPLLYMTKDNILDYSIKHNIPYAVDKSNSDDDYTRNRYRKYILPHLKQENNSVNKQFLSFSSELLECSKYIDTIIDRKYPKIVQKQIINISLILKEDIYIIREILRRYLYNYYGDDITKINNKHIEDILSLIMGKKPNGYVDLPNKNKLIRSYNNIYFDTKDKYNDYCFIFDGYINLPNGYSIKEENNLNNTTNYSCALLKSELKLPLYVRNRQIGDKMDVLNLKGSKKINDIFIDSKVPMNERKNYPVLVDSDGNILWLPGLKKSKYDKSKQGKYDIILRYYKEEK